MKELTTDVNGEEIEVCALTEIGEDSVITITFCNEIYNEQHLYNKRQIFNNQQTFMINDYSTTRDT